ncbi:Ribosome maturation factor RimM [Clarias magur]|uniref:Ribosome maturation factor RimM n=1 Tax=Clarias magur TaxID=1594786 RepID=A0A8J4U2U0_CLAMG|nr:Ribosome maturation factor RimM [Clarias magur]
MFFALKFLRKSQIGFLEDVALVSISSSGVLFSEDQRGVLPKKRRMAQNNGHAEFACRLLLPAEDKPKLWEQGVLLLQYISQILTNSTLDLFFRLIRVGLTPSSSASSSMLVIVQKAVACLFPWRDFKATQWTKQMEMDLDYLLPLSHGTAF